MRRVQCTGDSTSFPGSRSIGRGRTDHQLYPGIFTYLGSGATLRILDAGPGSMYSACTGDIPQLPSSWRVPWAFF